MRFITEKDENISKEIAAATTELLFTFQVPSRAKMVNIRLSNYINEFDAWGFITWILKRNGTEIAPYGKLKDQIAFGAPLRQLAGIEIFGADKFEIFVKNEYIDGVKCGVALKFDIIQEN